MIIKGVKCTEEGYKDGVADIISEGAMADMLTGEDIGLIDDTFDWSEAYAYVGVFGGFEEDAHDRADEDITECIDEVREEGVFVTIEVGIIEVMNEGAAFSAFDGSFKGGSEG